MAILVIGAIAVGGLLIYQRYRPTTNTTQATNQHQQKNGATTQAYAEPYKDWKIYCDSTLRACIKYPADWIASQYGGLENPACTEYAALTGPTNKDRGSHTAYIASISELSTPVSDLRVVGMVVGSKPSYSIFNASYIKENNIQVGATQDITDANYRFTGKTGDAGLVGTPCANGYTAITTIEQAKTWFNTIEGKTVLKVMQSFYYQ